jgi:[ribosomal protein S5]-alanine N-acetyltransferase
MLIHTPNLRLLTCERAHLDAIVRDPKSLGEHLGVAIPDGWPAYPKAYPQLLKLLDKQPTRRWSGWWLYLFVHVGERALVGCGGFRAAPDAQGVVELGFEIAPAFRDRGFGSEAISGLIRYAFTRPEVAAVVALSLPKGDPRARAFEAAGMRPAGEVMDAVAGRVTQWRVEPADLLKSRRKAA